MDLFENYISGNFGKVYLGDDQACDITVKGDVKIQLNGSVWKLDNVRHVPDLRKNLISIGQLASDGYVTTFTGDKWKILNGTMTITRGTKNGTLYTTTDGCGLAAVAEGKEDPNLWHQRFGHMNSQGLKCMQSRGKLPGLKFVEVDFCESCILGKQKRVNFKKAGRAPAKEKLELVHTDVWGPASVSSIGGKQYFVTFIDNHSRKVWVYFLRHKSDVFETFKKWKAMVENETGLKIKKLRSDNGGEYEDNEFKKFCYQSGIKLIRTVPGTPQQNGTAERMNRTLTEKARSMRL
jgi:transposase InsO family protein